MGLLEKFKELYNQDTGRDVHDPINQEEAAPLGPRNEKFAQLHDTLTGEGAPAQPPSPAKGP